MMIRLRDLGHQITHDWTVPVRSFGANPVDASHNDRVSWSDDDIFGIEAASLVWAMLPAYTSFGCAFEIGYAIGYGVTVIVSGNWKSSIFTSQCDARFDNHERALMWITLYTSQGSFDNKMLALEAM